MVLPFEEELCTMKCRTDTRVSLAVAFSSSRVQELEIEGVLQYANV
jgi:hypothetical protein